MVNAVIGQYRQLHIILHAQIGPGYGVDLSFQLGGIFIQHQVGRKGGGHAVDEVIAAGVHPVVGRADGLIVGQVQQAGHGSRNGIVLRPRAIVQPVHDEQAVHVVLIHRPGPVIAYPDGVEGMIDKLYAVQ